jgi:hypothetical protein
VLVLAAVLVVAAEADAVPDLWSKSGLVILAALSVGAVKVLFSREVKHSDYLRQPLEPSEAEVRRLNAEIQNSTLPAVVKATEVMGQLAAKARRGQT